MAEGNTPTPRKKPTKKATLVGPERVTSTDITDLTAAFNGVKDAVDVLAQRQVAAELTVEKKADTTEVDRLDGIINLLWFAVIVAILSGLLAVGSAYFGWRSNSDRLDDIAANRVQARTGLCIALDDMRAKHNHLVATIIEERQRIIDETNTSSASDERKAANNAFFQQQIASYNTDVLTILDCTEPDQVNSLFTASTTAPSTEPAVVTIPPTSGG